MKKKNKFKIIFKKEMKTNNKYKLKRKKEL